MRFFIGMLEAYKICICVVYGHERAFMQNCKAKMIYRCIVYKNRVSTERIERVRECLLEVHEHMRSAYESGVAFIHWPKGHNTWCFTRHGKDLGIYNVGKKSCRLMFHAYIFAKLAANDYIYFSFLSTGFTECLTVKPELLSPSNCHHTNICIYTSATSSTRRPTRHPDRSKYIVQIKRRFKQNDCTLAKPNILRLHVGFRVPKSIAYT